MASNGIASILFDFSGHGNSNGVRGKISLDSMQNDSRAIMEYAMNLEWVDKNNIFGLGHSLGTIPVLYNHKCFKGLILAAPPSRIKDSLNIFEIITYPLLYYLFALPYDNLIKILGLNKYFYLPYKFRKKDLFKNYNSQQKAEFDLQRFIPANFYNLIQKQDNIALAKESEKPALIFAAKFDRATGIKDAKIIYESLKTKDKELFILENSGHSIFWDQEKDLVNNKIVEWITFRIKSSTGGGSASGG